MAKIEKYSRARFLQRRRLYITKPAAPADQTSTGSVKVKVTKLKVGNT